MQTQVCALPELCKGVLPGQQVFGEGAWQVCASLPLFDKALGLVSRSHHKDTLVLYIALWCAPSCRHFLC
jgi:hypothetical protein